MASVFNDLLNEFDLGFLDHSCQKPPSDLADKQKKCVILTKKKIIATNSLVKAYYEKKNAYECSEKCLVESKVECKRVCMEYKNALEKCAKLEENEQRLQKATKLLNEKLIVSEDRFAALQCHVNQLQMLVKDLKTKLETYEIEKDLEQESNKGFEKIIKQLENDKQNLENQICVLGDVIVGSKKLDGGIKKLLKKYNKEVKTVKKSTNADDCTKSETLRDVSWPDNVESFDCKKNNGEMISDDNSTLYEICDTHDSDDYLNARTNSVDTGRGSSIGFSPEYSIDRPHIENKSVFDDHTLENYTEIVTISNTCERGTSPLRFESDSTFKQTQTSPDAKNSKTFKSVATSPMASIRNESAETCDTINNKSNIDIGEDNEVTTILSEMRLPFDFVTPLPSSPSICSSSTELPEAENLPQDTQQSDSAKIWKQFELLTARISNLENELKASNETKSKNLESNLLTKNIISKRREADINETENMDETYEDDIIQIPDLITPNNLNTTHDTHELQNKTCDIINTLQLIETQTHGSELILERNVDKECHDTECSIELTDKSRRRKSKKLSALQKLKISLIPKSKIKHTEGPHRSLRSKKKLLRTSNNEASQKLINKANSKKVYEKALAVVAQIRAEQNKEQSKLKRTSQSLQRNRNMNKMVEVVDTESNVTKLDYSDLNEIKSQENIDNIQPTDAPLEISPKRRRHNSDIDLKSIINCSTRTTRSQIKECELNNNNLQQPIEEELVTVIVPLEDNTMCTESEEAITNDTNGSKTKNILKRPSAESKEVQAKRKLRSSVRKSCDTENKSDNNIDNPSDNQYTIRCELSGTANGKFNDNEKASITSVASNVLDYNDLNMFEDVECEVKSPTSKNSAQFLNESLLCQMIGKYAKSTMKTAPKTIPADIKESISKTIEENIKNITTLKISEAKAHMDALADKLKILPIKHLLSGLIQYLNDPTRKNELFNKTNAPPAPPMSKQEQILLYVLTRLKDNWPPADLITELMKVIEYKIFRLNSTPEFHAIESLSHFYAVLCRFTRKKYQLRQFMLDAMYCISFKAVPLIRQCLDVWPHILPLAHMGIAKQPIVICFVYLLHFYKCKDQFHRVQEIRQILYRKYFYQITVWNDDKLIEMLRSAIMDVREIETERKMLRMAIIILAKRNGAKWCDKNIIKRILLPMIEKQDLTEKTRTFCVSVLGPLLRPYPDDMRVHKEIVMNQLFDMLENQVSPKMEEAIFSSLIYFGKHNQERVGKALALWRPRAPLSARCEERLRSYVREKPLKTWKRFLSQVLS